MTQEERLTRAGRLAVFQRARSSRAPIIELAVRAEYVLGEALAWEYAASEPAAAILQEHMLWRVPIETKLKLLGEVMKAHDLADLFPFVIPILTRLFQVRNVLAHSLETPVSEESRELTYLSVHRGRTTQHALRLDFLAWLRKQAEQVYDELWLISGTLADLRTSKADHGAN